MLKQRQIMECAHEPGSVAVPTLFRLLAVVAVIGGCIYAGIFALANLVPTEQREITVTIPPAKYIKR